LGVVCLVRPGRVRGSGPRRGAGRPARPWRQGPARRPFRPARACAGIPAAVLAESAVPLLRLERRRAAPPAPNRPFTLVRGPNPVASIKIKTPTPGGCSRRNTAWPRRMPRLARRRLSGRLPGPANPRHRRPDIGPPQARAPRDSAACCGCSRKTATETPATDGINGILARWPVYALVAAVVIGRRLDQSALHVGPWSASQPLLAIVNPLVSISATPPTARSSSARTWTASPSSSAAPTSRNCSAQASSSRSPS
jgi:hypothetical protein